MDIQMERERDVYMFPTINLLLINRAGNMDGQEEMGGSGGERDTSFFPSSVKKWSRRLRFASRTWQ